MRTADDIKRFFQKAPMDTNPRMDQAVLDKVLTAHEQAINSPSATTEPTLWRILMKSPIVRIAMAAVIIIVCYSGVVFWTSTGSGIALADVLIIGQGHGQFQQVILVLLVDPAQGITVTEFKLQYKDFVFYHLAQGIQKDLSLPGFQ